MTPSVQAIDVKEWPAPTHFTRCPDRTASTTMRTSSASLVGRRMEAGAHTWLPAQFDHEDRSFMLTRRNLAVGLAPPSPRGHPPGDPSPDERDCRRGGGVDMGAERAAATPARQ